MGVIKITITIRTEMVSEKSSEQNENNVTILIMNGSTYLLSKLFLIIHKNFKS